LVPVDQDFSKAARIGALDTRNLEIRT